MKKSLLVLITLISLNSFGQASSQMNNLLNVDSGINPPNIVYTLPAPASTWQRTNLANLSIPVSQVTGLQPALDSKISSELDPLFDSKFALKNTSSLTEGSNLYWTTTRFNFAFGGKTTNDLAELGNLYFTTIRARNSISANSGVNYDASTGNISLSKKRETLTGTTNSSGLVTFTFANTYSVAPNIQYAMGFGANIKDTIIPNSAPTTTSVTFLVQVRNDVLGLLPTYSNVSGREVNILVTEK